MFCLADERSLSLTPSFSWVPKAVRAQKSPRTSRDALGSGLALVTSGLLVNPAVWADHGTWLYPAPCFLRRPHSAVRRTRTRASCFDFSSQYQFSGGVVKPPPPVARALILPRASPGYNLVLPRWA